MLLELRFKDFVLIPEAHLILAPGFTVLTGETGAGKSLLMQGLSLLLGARGGPHLIRLGAEEAVVEAVIVGGEVLARRLSEMGYEPVEEVLLRRVITKTKGRVYINGSPATLQMLSRLTEGLILLASQHEHQLLANPEDRLRLLDQFAGVGGLLARYQEAFKAYRQVLQEYQALAEKLGRLEKERDFLRFQIEEIEAVAPVPGEDKALSEEREVLRNMARLQELLGQAVEDLESSVSATSRAKKNLSSAAEFDHRLDPLVERLEGLFYELEDTLFSLRDHLGGLSADEGRLEEIEERLDKLNRLKRKYGQTLEEVLTQLEVLKEEYQQLELGEEGLRELGFTLKEREEKALSLAKELSVKRKEAGRRLSQAVMERLAALGMAEACFVVEVKSEKAGAAALGPWGLDRVEFLVATNPKAEPRPLTKVASGGELSRIFLSLKTALSEDQKTQVLIFDEVDAGIGGLTAAKVGAMLKELSRHQQVICVTHLPQIAALADHHFVVEKESDAEEARTKIKALSPEERVEEIARMLGEKEARELAAKMLGMR